MAVLREVLKDPEWREVRLTKTDRNGCLPLGGFKFALPPGNPKKKKRFWSNQLIHKTAHLLQTKILLGSFGLGSFATKTSECGVGDLLRFRRRSNGSFRQIHSVFSSLIDCTKSFKWSRPMAVSGGWFRKSDGRQTKKLQCFFSPYSLSSAFGHLLHDTGVCTPFFWCSRSRLET